MAAATGKIESVSSSLFMEVKNLEVEEELSTMATLVSGWEDGRERESIIRLGGSRSLRFRHGDK